MEFGRYWFGFSPFSPTVCRQIPAPSVPALCYPAHPLFPTGYYNTFPLPSAFSTARDRYIYLSIDFISTCLTFYFIQFSLPSALSSFKSLFYFCSLLPAPPPLVPSITLPARPFTSPPAPLLLILHHLVLPLLLVMFAHRLNAIR